MSEEAKNESVPQAPAPATELSPQEVVKQLWLRGSLSWKLHKTQSDMYQAFHNCPEYTFVINCSRQLGKSYFLCVLAIEYALQHPGSQIKYAAGTQKMVKRIIAPIFRQILADCPDEIRPEWKAQEGLYLFKNDSQIDIAGADAGNAESLRGTRMHLGIVDEAGFVTDLDYLVKDIFLPMTLTTRGKIIIASTPSKLPRHPFEEYYKQALLLNASIHKTIYDNPLVSPDDVIRFMREAGGENSTTWKREFLAQFIVDEKLVVIPEFTPALETKLVVEIPRPQYVDNYVAMDVGSRDFTAILFGYWDFLAAKLVVEDEIFLQGSKEVRTDLIAARIKTKEEELWKTQRPYFRIADRELLLINDLESIYGLHFIQTDKDDKEAAIAELRVMLQSEKIIIHPRCKQLVSHIRYAVWDAEHQKFARIKGFGHFDGVDALVYMLRNVRRHHNPIPVGGHYNPNVHYSRPLDVKTPNAKTLENIFKGGFLRSTRFRH